MKGGQEPGNFLVGVPAVKRRATNVQEVRHPLGLVTAKANFIEVASHTLEKRSLVRAKLDMPCDIAEGPNIRQSTRPPSAELPVCGVVRAVVGDATILVINRRHEDRRDGPRLQELNDHFAQ